ncbi:hypothetical protein F511_25113 [Dorcoceras hygrometricum]|uniref:Uncharacterized protein n=1 Tax=Dorcoceras hygrometricum TaxID=472368 RepID=A0A2Z7BJG4_9LAMI|nr:hypothetical protein F511_25113 [Dorcoceras hygrometricum]
MASSLFTNTIHVDYDAVLAMENPGMVAMFQSLVASVLIGFLGCPAVLYEDSVTEFFENGSVRDGLVVSTVNGVNVEISETMFAETFELPIEGLTELSEIPKDVVIDEVQKFFNSFCLKKLATLQIDESYFDKEALVLSWAEAESTRIALNRKVYILMKYREVLVRKFLESWKLNFVPGERSSATDIKVIDMLSDLPLFILEEFKQQTLAHGLQWAGRVAHGFLKGAHEIAVPKGVLANSASVTADLMVVKKAVRELNAKVDAVSTGLVDVRKDLEATKESISHQLLEFQAQAQANHNILTDQLSELVIILIGAEMTKRGKVVAEVLNHHLMIITEEVAILVVVVIMLEPQALWRDLLMLIDGEKGAAKVEAEGIEVDLTREEDIFSRSFEDRLR